MSLLDSTGQHPWGARPGPGMGQRGPGRRKLLDGWTWRLEWNVETALSLLGWVRRGDQMDLEKLPWLRAWNGTEKPFHWGGLAVPPCSITGSLSWELLHQG